MEDAEVLEITVPESAAGQRVDRAACDLAGGRLSRTQVKHLIDDGDLLLEGRQVKPSEKVRAGHRITLFVPPPPPSTLEPEDIPLDIVFEDEHLIVLDKPSGLVVHPAAGNPRGTLANALLFHRSISCGDPGRPGIVHRLDKDTSGLMIVARHEKAHRDISALISAHHVTREYLALVLGRPPDEGVIRTPYGRSHRDRKKFTSKLEGDVRAVTRYRIQARYGGGSASLARLVLETGRTHQIRVHMSESGWPLIGDPIYGRRPPAGPIGEIAESAGRTMLHATHLEFTHPETGRWMEFTREPPEDFRSILDALGHL